MLLGIFLSFVIVAAWALALYRWFESREVWNGGICADNGLCWQVKDLPSGLYLFAGDRAVRISGVLVYGAILREID